MDHGTAQFPFFVIHATVTVHSASDINVSEIKCRINTQDDIVWLRGTAKAIQICKLLVCSQNSFRFRSCNHLTDQTIFTGSFAPFYNCK